MTRVLAELLGAHDPAFHHGLRGLESASGHTSADIRLSSEIERLTRAKLRELGLDPTDTTGPELYAALQQRIKDDDARLSASLRERFGDGAVNVNVGKALTSLPVPKSCFALKTAVGRKIVLKNPPKQTMKLLGYRSQESMLRREQLLAVFAAAWLIESASWRKAIVDAYKKLSAADFEIRPIAIISPADKHWDAVARTVVATHKHNIVGLREFGAVVVLPLPEAMPPASTMTSLLMGLHEMNDVRASSTFLKLCQVRPDFGASVQTVVTGEPTLAAQLLDTPVQWHIIQRYYSRFSDRFREDLFAPHIQREDLSWHSVERALSYLEPSLSFWHHTATLGLLDGHKPVSLNVIDAALNFCNELPYASRLTHYLRRNVWSELIIRYLKHDAVEQAVLGSLESRLVDEEVLV